MIGLIGAMDEEIAILADLIENRKSTVLSNREYMSGTLSGVDVVLVKSGIGKVNAALVAQQLATEFSPDIILNCGSSGGLRREFAIGDVVIASELCYHDADARGFGYALGQIPGMPEVYTADEKLLHSSRKLPAEQGYAIHYGQVVSGDSFLSDAEKIDVMSKNFPNAIAVEMESCAIAQTCHILDIPFLVIRAISDHADGNSPEDFSANLHRASINSAQTIIELLKVL